MDTHHYLGALPKIGHTVWYIASVHNQWLARVSFSAAAWKCAARDQWIGWNYRYQYDRLHLIANNSLFLILLESHYPNLASRVLSLCERRIAQDWQERFGCRRRKGVRQVPSRTTFRETLIRVDPDGLDRALQG